MNNLTRDDLTAEEVAAVSQLTSQLWQAQRVFGDRDITASGFQLGIQVEAHDLAVVLKLVRPPADVLPAGW